MTSTTAFRFDFFADASSGGVTPLAHAVPGDAALAACAPSGPRATSPLEVVAADLCAAAAAVDAWAVVRAGGGGGGGRALALRRPALAPARVDALTGAAGADVVRGVYEGGGKLWECTLDVLALLCGGGGSGSGGGGGGAGGVDVRGRAVLDLGCGAALLAAACVRRGARAVVAQDLNASVLAGLAAPTLGAALADAAADGAAGVADGGGAAPPPVLLLAGSWAALADSLSGGGGGGAGRPPFPPRSIDVVVSAETLYDPGEYPSLLRVLRAALRPGGRAFFGTKRLYFGAGLGGGSDAFERAAAAAGFAAARVATVQDGGSMTRDVLELTPRERE